MKKALVFYVLTLVFAGSTFGGTNTGAFGFGITSDSTKSSGFSSAVRGSFFIDYSARLPGSVNFGFEIQGDVLKLDEGSFLAQQTDMQAFGLDDGDYVIFVQTSEFRTTYTLWDMDLCPRGYVSLDVSRQVELQGFLGLNYNWQTLDVRTRVLSGTPTIDGTVYNTGDTFGSSRATDGSLALIIGFRATIGIYYVELTRFLVPDNYGTYSFDQNNKSRLGLGINLRF